jgi:HD-GYP domain-containing protein (c-di-GMP phosphodiesterase class II)
MHSGRGQAARRFTAQDEECEGAVDLARRVGERLGLGVAELRGIELATRLHYVGKLAIDGRVLAKPGPLEPHEWSLIRRQAIRGARQLAQVPGHEGTATIVRAHHERWDGAGHPEGLSGSRIPLGSRIVAACAAYHAMVKDRPYRNALTRGEAARELRAESGSRFDPQVIDALLGLIDSSAP